MDNGKKTRMLEAGKNVLILLLSVSAVYLIGRSGVYKDFNDAFPQSGLTNVSNVVSAVSTNESTSLVEEVRPVRLAVQNQSGRYGAQYDSSAMANVYDRELKRLLAGALQTVKDYTTISDQQWRNVIAEKSNWVYYDFLGTVPIRSLSAWLGIENTKLTGNARCFLLSESAQGQVSLYYYDERNQSYYACRLSGFHNGVLSQELAGVAANGAFFAFEKPEDYSELDPYVMILPNTPVFPIYEAKNPLENLSDPERESLMRLFSFNPEASTVYQSADGLVICEGDDTLRILDSGTVTFHGANPEQARFPVHDMSYETLLEKSMEILQQPMAIRCGEARLSCLGLQEQQNGSITVTFAYLLNGSPVHLYEKGYAVQMTYLNGGLESFTIHFRQYSGLESQSVVMPEYQAAAAMKSAGQSGKELLVYYTDDGTGQVVAGWMAH